VVQIAFRDGKEERFTWLLRQFEGLFARGQRYVVFMDTTALSTIPSAATRHTIGNWQNAHKEQTKKLCVGTAILISSRLVRGALTAMNWVHEPVIKQYYPNTRREALDWCITTVGEAGLTINSRALAALKSRDG